MAEVALSPRVATCGEEESHPTHQQQQQHHPVGRVRRRKTTDEVIEEMEPLEMGDRDDATLTKPDGDDEHRQREKELKKDLDGTESPPPPYRYDAIDPNDTLSANHDQNGALESPEEKHRDGLPPPKSVQVEVATTVATMEITSPSDDHREGQPVAPVEAVSEQLRNLSSDIGDSLIIGATNAGPEQQTTTTLDTSRHSWHCDNESHATGSNELQLQTRTIDTFRTLAITMGRIARVLHSDRRQIELGDDHDDVVELKKPGSVDHLATGRSSGFNLLRVRPQLLEHSQRTSRNLTTDDLELSAIFTSNTIGDPAGAATPRRRARDALSEILTAPTDGSSHHHPPIIIRSREAKARRKIPQRRSYPNDAIWFQFEAVGFRYANG
uniref:Uncharacterized protein n=1 Tax=Anopheles farauti TaxID=69004 RepID=A0A182QK18_9DIPT